MKPKHKLTWAAYLLFVDSFSAITPLQIGRFKSDITIIDNIDIAIDIPTQVNTALNFIRKHLMIEFIITGEAERTERYGSGIARIAKLCQEHGVIAPMFEEFQHGFRVTLYKAKLEGVSGGVNELFTLITTVSSGNSSRQLVESLGVSQRTLERWLKQLKEENKIEFRGATKTGGYYAK